ncbi:MAG: hypothetical protein QW688_07800 [Thermoprotei archaeon]
MGVLGVANPDIANSDASSSPASRSAPNRLLVVVVIVLVVLSVVLVALLYSTYTNYSTLKSEYTRLNQEVVGSPPAVPPILSASQISTVLDANATYVYTLNGSNSYGSMNMISLSGTLRGAAFYVSLSVFSYPSPIYAKANNYESFLYVSGHTMYNASSVVSGWNYTYCANGTSTNYNYVFLSAYRDSLQITITVQGFPNSAVAVNKSQLLDLLSSQISLL